MCAVSCRSAFSSFCGGKYEPLKEKKEAEFGQVVMKSAKEHMKEVEMQLVSRFESNVGQAAGMKAKTFLAWMGQQKPMKRCMVVAAPAPLKDP